MQDMKLNRSQSRKKHNQVTLFLMKWFYKILTYQLLRERESRLVLITPFTTLCHARSCLLSPDYGAFASKLAEIQIPSNIQEAIQINEWKQAITEELKALEKNGK